MAIEVEDAELLKQLSEKYRRAMHALQSGVAMMMEIDGGGTSPKHLRVGVNSAMVSDAAMLDLLIAKGICTRTEFMERLVKAAEEEKSSYEDELSRHFGKKVVLE